MAMCWDSDPKQRPDFSRLIRAISNSLEATTDYLKVHCILTMHLHGLFPSIYTLQLTLEESMTTVKSPFVDKVDQRFIVPRCCLDMTDIPIGTGIHCAWILYKHVFNTYDKHCICSAGSFGETFKATVRRNEDVVEIVAVKVIDGNCVIM